MEDEENGALQTAPPSNAVTDNEHAPADTQVANAAPAPMPTDVAGVLSQWKTDCIHGSVAGRFTEVWNYLHDHALPELERRLKAL